MRKREIWAEPNETLGVELTGYSLVLAKNGEIICSSRGTGLRPLVECIHRCRSRFSECTLYDRVIGLAAARLVVYSDMISLVLTRVCSEAAKALLTTHNIEVKALNIVSNIHTQDELSICPMERMAQTVEDNESVFSQLRRILDV